MTEIKGARLSACAAVGANPGPNTVVFVYLESSQSNNICSGKVFGTCGKRSPIQVAYIHNTTGMPNDCGYEGIQGVQNVTGHSVSLDAMGKLTGNLLLKTITNPTGTGWLDAQGRDIGSKCEQVFPPDGVFQPLSNGSIWRLRAFWSNRAYTNGTGLPNSLGQNGCVY